MKKRRLPFLVALGLSLCLLSIVSVPTAFAAPLHPPAPFVPTCTPSETDWPAGQQRWWTDTGNQYNYNQRLDVYLQWGRDHNTGENCDELRTYVILTYKNVGAGSSLIATVIDSIFNGAQYNSTTVPADHSGMFTGWGVKTDPVGTPCGYATGEWFYPGVIDAYLRVPSSGYWCSP
jgi:hypothetical protein